MSYDKRPAKIDIRHALATLQHAVDDYVNNARLAPQANVISYRD